MKIQMEIYLKTIKICLNYVSKPRPLIEIIKTRFLMEKKYNLEKKKEIYQELSNIENGLLIIMKFKYLLELKLILFIMIKKEKRKKILVRALNEYENNNDWRKKI